VMGDSRYPERRVSSRYYGTAGAAAMDGMPFRVTLSPHDQPPKTYPEADLPPVPTPVENFVAVIQGHAEPLAPPEHGIAIARVMEAAYESARTGRTVRLG